MKKLITYFGLKFNATQFEWGRRLFGGTYYLISVTQLSMGSFWSDTIITSCQAKVLETKVYVIK